MKHCCPACLFVPSCLSFHVWHLQDPVTNSPAVLVALYSITTQKDVEQQLHTAQEVLQQ